MTIFYSDQSLFKYINKYCPATLHLSPATRILNENPGVVMIACAAIETSASTNQHYLDLGGNMCHHF